MESPGIYLKIIEHGKLRLYSPMCPNFNQLCFIFKVIFVILLLNSYMKTMHAFTVMLIGTSHRTDSDVFCDIFI